jgi:hypothetical protein
VEVGVHGTTYFSGLYNPLVSGQLASDLGGWGFSYLLGAYIYKSPMAWSDTSLNQRFALYDGRGRGATQRPTPSMIAALKGRMNEFAEVIQSVLARATLLLCAGDRELRR